MNDWEAAEAGPSLVSRTAEERVASPYSSRSAATELTALRRTTRYGRRPSW